MKYLTSLRIGPDKDYSTWWKPNLERSVCDAAIRTGQIAAMERRLDYTECQMWRLWHGGSWKWTIIQRGPQMLSMHYFKKQKVKLFELNLIKSSLQPLFLCCARMWHSYLKKGWRSCFPALQKSTKQKFCPEVIKHFHTTIYMHECLQWVWGRWCEIVTELMLQNVTDEPQSQVFCECWWLRCDGLWWSSAHRSLWWWCRREVNDCGQRRLSHTSQ